MARACIWRKNSWNLEQSTPPPDILGGFVVYFASVVSFTDIFTSLIYYIISKKWEYNAALICTTHVNATFSCLPKMNFRVPLSINCELYSVCTPITLPFSGFGFFSPQTGLLHCVQFHISFFLFLSFFPLPKALRFYFGISLPPLFISKANWNCRSKKAKQKYIHIVLLKWKRTKNTLVRFSIRPICALKKSGKSMDFKRTKYAYYSEELMMCTFCVWVYTDFVAFHCCWLYFRHKI